MTNAETIAKLAQLTQGIRTCMLTTLDDEGRPHSRPMATQEVTRNGVISFLTSKASLKSREIEEERTVNLSYADDSNSRYVSITGRAELSDDREKIHQLWSVFYKAWWPAGEGDPDIVVLSVQIEQAEYWDAPGGKVIQLLGLAKAALLGQEQKAPPGAHGLLHLH